MASIPLVIAFCAFCVCLWSERTHEQKKRTKGNGRKRANEKKKKRKGDKNKPRVSGRPAIGPLSVRFRGKRGFSGTILVRFVCFPCPEHSCILALGCVCVCAYAYSFFIIIFSLQFCSSFFQIHRKKCGKRNGITSNWTMQLAATKVHNFFGSEKRTRF